MMSTQEKQKLKQQAKSMLLKGCYKIASNKYKRLIEDGATGFSQRQWAVINLNSGISLQFLDRLDEALQRVNQAIKIDQTYQKAYYRRLQILEQQGDYERAISDNIVPYFIKNKEIDELQTRIRSEYMRQLGLKQLQAKILNSQFIEKIGKNNLMNFMTESYQKIFERMKQMKQSKQSITEEIATQIADHYRFLKLNKMGQVVEQFCHHFRRFILLGLGVASTRELALIGLFNVFWEIYQAMYMTERWQDQGTKHQKISQQQKLISYFPCITMYPQTFIRIINLYTKHRIRDNQQHLNILLQFLHINSLILQNCSDQKTMKYLNDNIEVMMMVCAENLREKLNMFDFSGYFRLSLVVQSLKAINKMLLKKMKMSLECSNNSFQSYGEAFMSVSLYIECYDKSVDLLVRNLAKLLAKNNEDFSCIYLIQETLYKVRAQELSKYGQPLEQVVFDLLSQQPPQTKKALLSQMLLYSIFCRIGGFKIKKIISQQKTHNYQSLSQALSGIQNRLSNVSEISAHLEKYNPSSSKHLNSIYIFMMYLKCLGFLVVLSPEAVINITNSHVHLNRILQTLFLETNQHNKMEQFISVGLMESIKIIYVCVIDIEQEQEIEFAHRMGVSHQQISKARKLQGERLNEKTKEGIEKSREKFISNFFSEENNWSEVLCSILTHFMNLEDANPNFKQSTQSLKIGRMATEILYVLSCFYEKKCTHPIFTKFMLKHWNSNEPKLKQQNVTISKYMCNICKKCNPQIFQYPQHQQISNILVFGIENSEHQLHTFESLLGLVQLSTQKISIPLQFMINLLIEENQYIVHAAFELINNMLVNLSETVTSQQTLKFLCRIVEIMIKYYKYYHQVIRTKQYNNNFTDYAHPCKIYCTLISLSMVFEEICQNVSNQQAQKLISDIHRSVHELTSEEQAEKTLDCLDGDFSVLLFKLGMQYGKNSSKLLKEFNRKYGSQLQLLKSGDYEKWQKLQYYINH